jgi:hypothetical protein
MHMFLSGFEVHFTEYPSSDLPEASFTASARVMPN